MLSDRKDCEQVENTLVTKNTKYRIIMNHSSNDFKSTTACEFVLEL